MNLIIADVSPPATSLSKAEELQKLNKEIADEEAAIRKKEEDLEKKKTSQKPGHSQSVMPAAGKDETGAWDREATYVWGGSILGFALITMGLMAFLIMRRHNPLVILRTFTIPFVAALAVILIIVGYSQDQMAPVMGLLGTIVGYLLGKDTDKKEVGDEVTKKSAHE